MVGLKALPAQDLLQGNTEKFLRGSVGADDIIICIVDRDRIVQRIKCPLPLDPGLIIYPNGIPGLFRLRRYMYSKFSIVIILNILYILSKHTVFFLCVHSSLIINPEYPVHPVKIYCVLSLCSFVPNY